jgi:hypothetical protein
MAKPTKAARKKELEEQIQEITNKIAAFSDEVGMEERVTLLKLEKDNLEQQIRDLNKIAAGSTPSKEISKLIDALNNETGQWAYITSRQQFINVDNRSKNPAISNVQELAFSVTAACQSLSRKAGLDQGDIQSNELITVFDKTGRSYDSITASFDTLKWSDDTYFNMMTARRQYFCEIIEPIEGETIQYHEAFDILMMSLGDGKEENTKFLETYLAYKRVFPERHVSTPDLILIGLNGGEGKGILTEIAISTFTSAAISRITNKQIGGGFNALLRGAVFAILDDQSKKDMNQEALLSLGGNDTMVIEEKGVDAVNEDKCGNMIILSNKPNIISLAGTGISGVDRRWSYLVTATTFMNAIKAYFLRKDGTEKTDLEAKEYATKVSIEVFKNRQEVSKWISAMIVKHDIKNMNTLLPCHGEDYQRAVASQKDVYSGIFERVVPEMLRDFGFLPLVLIRSIVSVETTIEIKRQDNKFTSKFEIWLEKNGYTVDKRDRTHVNWVWANSQTGLSEVISTKQSTVYVPKGKSPTFDYDISNLLKVRPVKFDGTFTEENYKQEDNIIKDELEIQTQLVPTGYEDADGLAEYEQQEIVVIPTTKPKPTNELMRQLNNKLTGENK